LLPPDRRLRQYQSGKRQCVVVIRERDGVTLPGVFKSEGEALDFIRRKIARGTEVHADESGAWNPHRLCRETTKQSVLLLRSLQMPANRPDHHARSQYPYSLCHLRRPSRRWRRLRR